MGATERGGDASPQLLGHLWERGSVKKDSTGFSRASSACYESGVMQFYLRE